MPRTSFPHLAGPQNYRRVLSEIRTQSWPPRKDDIISVARTCSTLIEALYKWETAMHGRDVIDEEHGQITTAEARRLLVQEAAISGDGDMAVVLVLAGAERVRVEIRASADESQGRLRQPEMVLSWEVRKKHEFGIPLESKGPHWYLLSQLRDDLREGRLVA